MTRPAHRDGLRVAVSDPSNYTRLYDHQLAEALAARGHEVTLWASPFPYGDAPPPGGYHVREHFYRRTSGLPEARSLRRAGKAAVHPLDMATMAADLVRHRPDVLHVQWAVMHSLDGAAYRAVRRAGVPVVYTCHDAMPNVGGEAAVQRAAQTAHRADQVIVHGEWGRDVLVRRHGLDRRRVHVVPHGVFSHLAELPQAPSPHRKRGPLVVMPGLIRPYKGLDVLLAAWPQVRAQLPRAELVVAGRPMMDLRTVRVRQPGVAVLPRYLANPELAALLREADVVALPYRSIDNSGVLFAALAVAAPVVLSDVGGFRELHEALGVGELVPPGDADALAGALVGALADPERAARLRAASAAAAARALGWDGIAERTEAVYRAAIDGR